MKEEHAEQAREERLYKRASKHKTKQDEEDIQEEYPKNKGINITCL